MIRISMVIKIMLFIILKRHTNMLWHHGVRLSMTRATALTRRRDKHTPLDQTRLKAEKKSDDGSGVAR